MQTLRSRVTKNILSILFCLVFSNLVGVYTLYESGQSTDLVTERFEQVRAMERLRFINVNRQRNTHTS